MRSEIRRMKLEQTFEEQDTLNQAAGAWNIECLRYEIREIISPGLDQADNGDAGGSRTRKRAESLQK